MKKLIEIETSFPIIQWDFYSSEYNAPGPCTISLRTGYGTLEFSGKNAELLFDKLNGISVTDLRLEKIIFSVKPLKDPKAQERAERYETLKQRLVDAVAELDRMADEEGQA